MLNIFHALEVTVISAEDLTVGNKPIKTNAFAILKTNDCSHPMSMDKEGGGCPWWNERMFVNLPRGSSHIVVVVQLKGLFGVKVIGGARILVSDFAGVGSSPQGHLHVLSYWLRDIHGVRNGIVSLSIRVKSPTPQVASSSWSICEIPTSGRKDDSGTVVAGIPVWFANRNGWKFQAREYAKIGIVLGREILLRRVFIMNWSCYA